ncbi:MAG: hypothetical protein K9N51_10115, partial [Candidatus Pacebacteria bacterium]|nr:hypothetical protein [Candidatus Paceibacterota bacterium]
MKEPGYDKKKARQDQEVLPDASAQTDEPSPKGYRVPRGDADGESTATTFDIRQIIGLCLTYWWLILLLAIMGTAGGVAYCFLARPSYQAMCRYEIFSEHMLAVGEASTMERQTRQLGRQMMLIQSDSLRNRVANKLAPEWEAKVQELKPEVNIRRNGTVLYVYAETDNEEYAVAFLKELIAQYEEMRRMEEMTANESALRRLRLEKMRLENEWQDSKQRLVAFRERHQLRQIAQQYEYDQKFIDKLLQRQQSLRTERAMIGIQLRALKDADAPTVQDVLALSLEAHGATSGQG